MTSKKNHPGINNGRMNRWLRDNKFTGLQVEVARTLLMSGPRAQAPSWRAIRKTLGRLRRNDKPGPHGYGSWRDARAV